MYESKWWILYCHVCLLASTMTPKEALIWVQRSCACVKTVSRCARDEAWHLPTNPSAANPNHCCWNPIFCNDLLKKRYISDKGTFERYIFCIGSIIVFCKGTFEIHQTSNLCCFKATCCCLILLLSCGRTYTDLDATVRSSRSPWPMLLVLTFFWNAQIGWTPKWLETYRNMDDVDPNMASQSSAFHRCFYGSLYGCSSPVQIWCWHVPIPKWRQLRQLVETSALPITKPSLVSGCFVTGNVNPGLINHGLFIIRVPSK